MEVYMAQMTDPHNALVSFQEALLGGVIQPIRCSLHQELSYLVDIPITSPRITYALIDSNSVVKALVLFAREKPVGGSLCFAIGYAVAEPFRRQGLAHEIVEKALAELSIFFKGQTPRMYINAVVGVDNAASQKVAARFINDEPDSITDEISGLPAFHYMRLIQL